MIREAKPEDYVLGFMKIIQKIMYQKLNTQSPEKVQKFKQ